MQMNAASGASARVAPPAVATIFPPFSNRRKTGTGVADHRRSRGEHADQRTADPEPERGSGEPLREIEQRDRDAERAAVHAEDVRRTDVPAPLRPDVLATDELRHPVAERHRAEVPERKQFVIPPQDPSRPESAPSRRFTTILSGFLQAPVGIE